MYYRQRQVSSNPSLLSSEAGLEKKSVLPSEADLPKAQFASVRSRSRKEAALPNPNVLPSGQVSSNPSLHPLEAGFETYQALINYRQRQVSPNPSLLPREAGFEMADLPKPYFPFIKSMSRKEADLPNPNVLPSEAGFLKPQIAAVRINLNTSKEIV